MGAFEARPSAPGAMRSEKTMSRQDQNTFLYGSNATFIAELYSRFLDDPGSVDESWRSFFADLSEEAPDILKEMSAPHWGRARGHIIANGHAGNGQAATALAEAPATAASAPMTAITPSRSRMTLPPNSVSCGARRAVYWLGLSKRSSSSTAEAMSDGSALSRSH